MMSTFIIKWYMEFSHSEPVGICWLDTDTQSVFYLILVYVFDPAMYVYV